VAIEGKDKDCRRGKETGRLRGLVARVVPLELETLERVPLRVVNMLESDSELLVLSTDARGSSEPNLKDRADRGLSAVIPDININM
jgi:hypothetical protein